MHRLQAYNQHDVILQHFTDSQVLLDILISPFASRSTGQSALLWAFNAVLFRASQQ
jgi:hypothetical protein